MGVMRFSSRELPESRRSSRYRELLGAVLNLELDSLDDEPLEVDAAMRLMSDGTVVAVSELSPLSMDRTAAHVADGNDNYVLSIPLNGDAFYRQRGKEVVCKPGEGVLILGDEPSYIANRKMARLSLSIPRATLEAAVGSHGTIGGLSLPESPALGLLASYSRVLTDGKTELTPELESLAVSHICDLFALAMGGDTGNNDVDMRPTIRAARLQLIREDILRNLHRHDLSLERVARRAGISTRYVQAILRGEGLTFRDFVLDQRLERAHAILSNPKTYLLPISEIAYSCGFGDLSYFNQTFRRRYAMTPSDVRKASQSVSNGQ